MDFDSSEMQAYFNSLPQETRDFIDRSDVKVSTLGELMEIGEHFKKEDLPSPSAFGTHGLSD